MKKVLFVTSEARPFAASGGLGDVAGSLPPAVKAASKGEVDIRVVMPLYASVSDEWRSKMKLICKFNVPLSWRMQYCGVFELDHLGVKWYFIDNEYYFKREMMYGSFDDGERYAFFCRAALDMLWHVGFTPDILHANDWQSAMCVMYHKLRGYYPEMRCVYTIHNIEYQGKYSYDILGDVFDLSDSCRDVVGFDGCINLMKGAIVCCDALTTVSPQYANEIKSEYFAQGLHGIISSNAYKLSGILNGIDTVYYDPRHDSEIVSEYGLTNIKNKALNKEDIQTSLGLPVRPDVPMIAMITRLVSHKGLDLVKRVADEILQDDVQFIMLGTGDAAYENFFRELAGRHQNKASVHIAFDRVFAKRIYASADMFLMPSKSEPCGLSQMIASRYGTVAIVRETGGLYDSIKPFNPETGEGNGFTFATYNAHDMLDAVRRACGTFRDKKQWAQVRRNAMKTDFSWKQSATEYLKLYNNL